MGIDTSSLAAVHIAAFEEEAFRERLHALKKAKRVLAKYSKRERSRAWRPQLEIARVVHTVCASVGLEGLAKQDMCTR